MGKWDEWIERVAGMERPELVDAYRTEAKLREKAQSELQATQAAAERDKTALIGKLKQAHHSEPLILIGLNHQHCEFAQRRMGINPNRCKFVYTDSLNTPLNGWWLKPEQIRLVRGWSEGRYAREIMDVVVAQMMKDSRCPGWDAIPYAPDPHDERPL